MLTYNPDLSKFIIITDKVEQHDKLFCEGHPYFLIPDFCSEPSDIWLSYEDYIESVHEEIYDQNGGEITSTVIIDDKGLTKIEYELYGISFVSDEDKESDYKLQIEGYVVTDDKEQTFFLATKVSGDFIK